jgi:hypothetical protein
MNPFVVSSIEKMAPWGLYVNIFHRLNYYNIQKSGKISEKDISMILPLFVIKQFNGTGKSFFG